MTQKAIPHISDIGKKLGLTVYESSNICQVSPIPDGSGWRAHFGIQTPQAVRDKLPEIGRDLIIEVSI